MAVPRGTRQKSRWPGSNNHVLLHDSMTTVPGRDQRWRLRATIGPSSLVTDPRVSGRAFRLGDDPRRQHPPTWEDGLAGTPPMRDHLRVASRLLLVEDDERIRASMRLALEDEGYEIDEAATGEEGLEIFGERPADVVLIDLMLPGIDGLECCRALRRISAVPVLVVTARSDTHDVVAGLEAGADDYVTKPFVAKELAARIRALLRRARSGDSSPSSMVFGDLEIRPEAGEVLVGGNLIPLTKTEFRLLCELANSPNRVFSREQLLERVWGYDYFGDGRLVDVHVRRLRTKVEADPAHPRYVVTSRGLGYKLQT